MIYSQQHDYKRVIQEVPRKPQMHNSKICFFEVDFSKTYSLTCDRTVQGTHFPTPHRSPTRTLNSQRVGLQPPTT